MIKFPKLKEHLKVLEANLKDKENISIVLGSTADSAVKIEGDYSILYLLSICDGVTKTNDILHKMKSSYDVENNDVLEVLSYLQIENVLEDGEINTTLSTKDLDRYSRHFIYYSMLNSESYSIQEKLKSSTVTLVGMGGIGNWVSLNLIAAGVGHIRGVDNDKIELSNLTRQILFSENDIGKYKVEVAEERLRALNNDTNYEAVLEKIIDVETAKDAIRNSDFVVLSADSPEHIHYWIDEACYELKIPWINVGYIDHWGVCGPIVIPDQTSCLICEMKSKDVREDELLKSAEIQVINTRMHTPSFGPLNGLVSSFASMEIMKFLTKYDTPVTIDKRWMIDSRTMLPKVVEYTKLETCIQCGISN